MRSHTLRIVALLFRSLDIWLEKPPLEKKVPYNSQPELLSKRPSLVASVISPLHDAHPTHDTAHRPLPPPFQRVRVYLFVCLSVCLPVCLGLKVPWGRKRALLASCALAILTGVTGQIDSNAMNWLPDRFPVHTARERQNKPLPCRNPGPRLPRPCTFPNGPHARARGVSRMAQDGGDLRPL